MKKIIDLKGLVNGAKEKVNNKSLAIGVGLTMVSGFASATTPVGGGVTNAAAAAITGLQTSVDSMFTSAWPVIITVTTGMVGIKLFKKMAGKI